MPSHTEAAPVAPAVSERNAPIASLLHPEKYAPTAGWALRGLRTYGQVGRSWQLWLYEQVTVTLNVFAVGVPALLVVECVSM